MPSWSEGERSAGIALGALVAKKRIHDVQPGRAVDLRIASVIAIWVVVGLAYSGSWAWAAAVGSGAWSRRSPSRSWAA